MTRTYSVALTGAAVRQAKKLPPHMVARVRARIEALASDPRPPDATMLTGYHGVFRVRVGDWRICYRVRDEELIVLVVTVADRAQVYELLKRHRSD